MGSGRGKRWKRRLAAILKEMGWGMKAGHRRRNRRRRRIIGGCLHPTPLFCFNRSWQHIARPDWHWSSKRSPPCTVTHSAGASELTLPCQTFSHYCLFSLPHSTVILYSAVLAFLSICNQTFCLFLSNHLTADSVLSHIRDRFICHVFKNGSNYLSESLMIKSILFPHLHNKYDVTTSSWLA